MKISPGILTKGLGFGASASSIILGRFNLGFFKIEIIIPPDDGQGGGGGGTTSRFVLPRRKVIFRVTYKEHIYTKTYFIKLKRINIIIKIINVVTIINTNIKLSVNYIKKIINKIRINRKWHY